MKRFAAAVAAAAVLVPAIHAVAGEVDNQFEGRIEKDLNTYMGLDVVKQNGKKFVANGIGYSSYWCVDDGPGYVAFSTGAKIRIGDDGRFSAKQRGVLDGGSPVTVRISGRVNGPVIKGSVGWRFTDNTATPTDDCYTGQRAYRVVRGVEVNTRP